MRVLLIVLLAIGGITLGAGSAAAGDVGNVKQQVQTGNVIQATQGNENKSELKIGTIKVEGNAGNIEQQVQTGNVIQATQGNENESEVKIGTIE